MKGLGDDCTLNVNSGYSRHQYRLERFEKRFRFVYGVRCMKMSERSEVISMDDGEIIFFKRFE